MPDPVLSRGDVLFFAPVTDGGASYPQFAHFPTLTAFMQSIPYGGDFTAPWHHVAVVVEAGPTPSIIGFSQEPTPSNFSSTLRRVPLAVDDRERIDVLRPPDGYAEGLAAASEEFIGRQFSELGLVASALAIEARVMPVSELRTRLENAAYGVAKLARADPHGDDETCATAVGRAVEKAGLTLTPVEPEAPQAAPDPGNLQEGYVGAVRQLLERAVTAVENRSSETTFRKLSAATTPEELVRQIKAAAPKWKSGIHNEPRSPFDVTKDTAALIEALEGAVGVLGSASASEALAMGASHGDPDAGNAVVSPAMLRQALLDVGFQELAT